MNMLVTCTLKRIKVFIMLFILWHVYTGNSTPLCNTSGKVMEGSPLSLICTDSKAKFFEWMFTPGGARQSYMIGSCSLAGTSTWQCWENGSDYKVNGSGSSTTMKTVSITLRSTPNMTVECNVETETGANYQAVKTSTVKCNVRAVKTSTTTSTGRPTAAYSEHVTHIPKHILRFSTAPISNTETSKKPNHENDGRISAIIIGCGTSGGLFIIIVVVIVVVATRRRTTVMTYINGLYRNGREFSHHQPNPLTMNDPRLPSNQSTESNSHAVNLEHEASYGNSLGFLPSSQPSTSHERSADKKQDTGLPSLASEDDESYDLPASKVEPGTLPEYTVVRKSKSKEDLVSQGFGYAVVKKARLKSKKTTARPGQKAPHIAPKPKRRNPTAPGPSEPEGDTYTNVEIRKSTFLKPEGIDYENMDSPGQGRPLLEVTSPAATDDKDNTLNFDTGHPKESCTDDVEYSNTGAVGQ